MSAARLVRHARRSAGFSQRALARVAGVPQSTVARIELGVMDPRNATLERLLHAAGRTLTTEPTAGIGVDRTQIHERLRLTPAERLGRMTAGARTVRLLRGARRVGRT